MSCFTELKEKINKTSKDPYTSYYNDYMFDSTNVLYRLKVLEK